MAKIETLVRISGVTGSCFAQVDLTVDQWSAVKQVVPLFVDNKVAFVKLIRAMLGLTLHESLMVINTAIDEVKDV